MMWNLKEVREDVQEFVPEHNVREQLHLLDVPFLSVALWGITLSEISPQDGTVTKGKWRYRVKIVHSCGEFLCIVHNFI